MKIASDLADGASIIAVLGGADHMVGMAVCRRLCLGAWLELEVSVSIAKRCSTKVLDYSIAACWTASPRKSFT
jgi:hypothetical protein